MKSSVRLATCCALLALGAASCTRMGAPAPIVAYGANSATSVPKPVKPLVEPTSNTAGEVVVRPGDTLYGISRRSNTPMRAIIEANNLRPPYVLQSGQHLNVPSVRTYVVQPGDTLNGVARRFGVGTSELVRANALPPPYNLRSGQALYLPETSMPAPTAVAGVPAAMVRPAEAPIAAPAAAAQTSFPVSPAPRMRGTSDVESTTLPAPGPSAPAAVASPSSAPVLPAPPASPVAALAPPPASTAVSAHAERPAASPPPAPLVQPASLPAASAPILEPEPPHAGRGFIWPVRGDIVSDYGGKPGGLQNDGINIGAPRGTPVRAADAGTVIYAGNELRGFGNLLLVRHKEGWVTAYAHAEELLVKRGDQVRRGQVIARVGSTGNVGSPQLHFEVRKGSRPLNPHEYLGPQTASATP